MPAKHAAVDGPTSRKRTADMLRRLRELNREVRMLKASIDAARSPVPRPRRQR
jgi:hypothetical protein